MLYVINRLRQHLAGYRAGMKLPLFRHGYQGKHQRGQIPRQRTADPAELSSADEREAREEHTSAASRDGDGDATPGGDAA